MSSSQLADGGVDVLPVLVQILELRLSLCGELVVLARRTGVRFLPLVVDESFPAHLAQQRIERPFLGGELGRAETLQHVGDVDLVAGNDAEDQELEKTFPDGAEFLRHAHGLGKLPLLNKVVASRKEVKPRSVRAGDGRPRRGASAGGYAFPAAATQRCTASAEPDRRRPVARDRGSGGRRGP